MRVTVKLTEPICRKTGQRLITVEIDSDRATLAEVFRHLGASYPELGSELAAGSDVLDSNYSILVNARLVSFAQSQQVVVKDGDQIAVMLPLAGG